MVKRIRNKRAAMEMTVGTIVTIVLLMSALVLGLILTKTVFRGATESTEDLTSGVKKEINNLFGEENKNLVISLGSQKTASVKQGTENFGVPMGFAPDNPQAWGINKDECFYNIEVVDQPNYCTGKEGPWETVEDVEDDILTGYEKVQFDELIDGNGYALIKINVPQDAPPCLQRFTVLVGCKDYPGEAVKTYFDIEVVKKGLF